MHKLSALVAVTALIIGMEAMNDSFAQENEICERAYQKAISDAFSSPKEALLYLESFQGKCDKDLLFQSRLASIYFTQKQYVDAERVVQAALKIDPFYPQLLFVLGDLRLVKRDPDSAMVIAGRMIEYHPRNYGGYYLMQRSLMDAKRFDESIEFGKNAIQLQNLPILWQNVAVASYHIKKYQQCVDSVYKAIQIDPNVLQRPWGVNEAIYALDALGKPAEALDLANRRKQADPNWSQDRSLVKALDLLPRKE